MEKSIKRVEKLVHATSSALAQMKFSLMFDDMSGGKNGQAGRTAQGFDAALLEKFLEADELNLRQNEFKLEANETLAKMDKISATNELSRKNLKPLDRIKEINQKMNHLKLEQSKRGETKQSRQKLLSLISEEKFSPGMTSGKESVASKQTARLNDEKELSDKLCSASRKAETKSPMKSKAELKNRILETQEIVDRGFQTARQLAQKVESMTKLDKKDRTPSTDKTVSEINLRSLEGKTESSETIKMVKCRRHSEKKKRKDFPEVEQKNARVIDIKRNEFEKESRCNLQLQHLPSLHIKGGLKIQKVHSLEIPASEEVHIEKTNTAVSFFSHEQMEREKMEKVLEKVRKENCVCLENENRTNYIECFNCGKLIRIRRTWVDPQRIDEVLRKCDFNVFDPRIDEFVEKYGTAERVSQPTVPIETEVKVLPKEAKSVVKEEPKKSKRFTLRDLSDQLCKKYKEEADALADSHLKLDAVLRNIFKKVEESKDVFETCHLLRNYKELERTPKLTTTKPVLVSLPGISLLVKNKQNKLDKKDVKNRSKSRTEFFEEKEILKTPKTTEKSKERILPFTYSDKEKNSPPVAGSENKEEAEVTSSSSHSSPHKLESDSKRRKIKKTLMMASVQRKNPKHLASKSKTSKTKEENSATSSTSSNKNLPIKRREEYFLASPVRPKEVSPSKSQNEEEKAGPCQTSPEKSENNYESDFESFTNELEEKGDEFEVGEPEINPVVKKLSTISEVDSELEKKLSDDQKTLHQEGERKEGNSLASGVSAKSKKTGEASLKSTPTELVTSLRDILSALQDQFARTESLAEKLTENSKVERKDKSELVITPDAMLNPWKMPNPAKLVENLQSSRKDWSPGPKTLSEKPNGKSRIPEEISIVSEEGGSSLGEIIVSEGRRNASGMSNTSSISEESIFNLVSEDRSLVSSYRREMVNTSLNLVS